MNYEQKYKDALERAREQYNKRTPLYDIESIFPELKESKDERIRKTIYGWIYTQPSEFFDINCFSKEEMIDWVEKQADKDKLIRELGEYKVKYTQKVLQEDLNKNTESQSQPKFKVGYWITDGRLTCKVLSVTGKSYELHLHNDDYCHFETDVQSVDKRYHLWTIEDAKDGDVLAEDSCIFIIRKLGDNGTAAKTYCVLHDDGDFNYDSVLYFDIDSTKPATKEQRDLLFQKITEAGYEWDSEKKELSILNLDC